MRCDQFHKVQFFLYFFFHVITLFFYFNLFSRGFISKLTKCLFLLQVCFKKSSKMSREMQRLADFFGPMCFIRLFYDMGHDGPNYTGFLTEIEYDHLVWRLILCCGTPISKPLKCLKMVKLWLSSSAKDHIGHKKVRGDWWWCLFCPSWPWN